MTKRLVFIRDDDVFELNKNLLKLHRTFMEERLPINYAVIPGRLDNKTADFLLSEKRKTPNLLDFVQHGWNHKNYGDAENKYEFGVKRSFLEQRNDIARGKKRMEQFFGPFFTHVFVPPYHRFNEETMKAVRENKFLGFSPSVSNEVPSGIVNIPVFNYDSNIPFKEFLRNFIKCYKRFTYFGICLHHMDLDSKKLKKLRNSLKLLRKVVENRKEELDFDFLTFHELIKKRGQNE